MENLATAVVSQVRRIERRPAIFLSVSLVVLMMFFLSSIAFGIVSVCMDDVLQAFLAFDGSREHLIVVDTRLPRAVLGVTVGAALGVAGAIMQSLARNPIAAPELLGINHGAALFVAAGSFFLAAADAYVFVPLAMAGAAVAASLSYSISLLGWSGPSSTKLVLAGAAITAISAAMIQLILILHDRTLDEMRIWLAGSLVGRDLGALISTGPVLILGLVLTIFLGTKLNVLATGDATAQSLGLSIAKVRFAAVTAVIAFAGAAVSLAGPIAFIGLAAPHLVRRVAGADNRWVIALSATIGASLLLVADISARFVIPGQEIPVGIMTALIGVPFFIAIARKGKRL